MTLLIIAILCGLELFALILLVKRVDLAYEAIDNLQERVVELECHRL